MFLQQLINGLTIGSTYALVAIGYTLIFGVLQLINFANGSMYMLSAYVTLMIYMAMDGHFLIAFLSGIVLTASVGLLMDVAGLRKLRVSGAPRLAGLISTMGMGIILDNYVLLFLGSESKSFPNLLDFGSFALGNAFVTWTQVIILSVTLTLMLLLSLLIYKTKFGKSIRAVSQNPTAAQLMGIDVNRVISISFMLSGALAAVAGVLVSMYYQSVDANMGMTIGMKTFAAAMLGGIGVLPGAVVGGLLIGIIETIGASYISSGYRNAIAFVVLVLVVLIKPTGLFGKQKITKV